MGNPSLKNSSSKLSYNFLISTSFHLSLNPFLHTNFLHISCIFPALEQRKISLHNPLEFWHKEDITSKLSSISTFPQNQLYFESLVDL